MCILFSKYIYHNNMCKPDAKFCYCQHTSSSDFKCFISFLYNLFHELVLQVSFLFSLLCVQRSRYFLFDYYTYLEFVLINCLATVGTSFYDYMIPTSDNYTIMVLTNKSLFIYFIILFCITIF